MCSVNRCDKPVNKDGVCLRHKLLSVSTDVGAFTREREGKAAAGDGGAAAYARSVYEKARARGIEPEPMNKESARFAPRRKLSEGGFV